MMKEILLQDSSGEMLTIRNIKHINRKRSTGSNGWLLEYIQIIYFVRDNLISEIVLGGRHVSSYDIHDVGMIHLNCRFDELSNFQNQVQEIWRAERLQNEKLKGEKIMADTAKNKRIALACVVVNGNRTFESFDVDDQEWRSMTTYEAAEYLNYLYPEVSIENYVRLLNDVFYKNDIEYTFRVDSETVTKHVAIELTYISSKTIEFVLGTFHSIKREFAFISHANPEKFRINAGLTQNRILTLYFKSGQLLTFEKVYDIEWPYPTISVEPSLTFRYYDYDTESFVEAEFVMSDIMGHTLTVEEGE